MKPFMGKDLCAVLDSQKKKLEAKVDSYSNEEILANNLELLASNLYEEFYIEPISIFDEEFSKRSVKQGKIRRLADSFFRNDREKEFIEVDGVIMTFYFPFTGDAGLFESRASTYLLSPYPEIYLNDCYFSLQYEYTLSELQGKGAKEAVMQRVEHDIKEIRGGISYANADVENYNATLKDIAMDHLSKKLSKVQSFFTVAAIFEVPVKKTNYAETHIPLKRKIAPIAHSYDKQNSYCINDVDYADILSTIKHTGSTYERTPSSYKSMQEEDLRNTLLATLNATYKGDAIGEAFRNHGKTDICIERENRAAFVAECKMWTGKKGIAGALSQLDQYLTWRDCKTALIFFVRRKDFLATLKIAEEALREIPEIKQVTAVDKNEFKCCMISSETPGQLIEVRVMLFNMNA